MARDAAVKAEIIPISAMAKFNVGVVMKRIKELCRILLLILERTNGRISLPVSL